MLLHFLRLLPHFIEVGVIFLFILSILVAAHEYGHYIFARMFKMGVEEFSVGMLGKKPLFTYMHRTYRIPILPGEDPNIRPQSAEFKLEGATNEAASVLIDTPTGQMLEETTAFTVRPYPIGGFVRIKGMVPHEDGSEVHVPGGFYSKAPWKRFIVLLAGPVFSVLAGVLVLIPLAMSEGIRKADNAPVLGSIGEGPASRAGLKSGDRIVSINQEPIQSFYQIVSKVQSGHCNPMKLTYLRDNKTYSTIVTPEIIKDTPTPLFNSDMEETGETSVHPLLLVSPVSHLVRVSLGEATVFSFKLPVMAVRGLLGIVKRPSTAKASVGGPVTMISATSEAVDGGFASVVSVAAMISISVGIFNLLPIFPLDGGQMVVAIAEMIRGGRRLSMRVQNVVGAMGLATVLLLAVCVLTVDFGRFFGAKPPVSKLVSQQKDQK